MKRFLFILTLATFALIYFYYPKNPPPQTWSQREQKVATLQGELQVAADQIKTLQGDGRCALDSECRVHGIGAKRCDAFSDFIIYSTTGVNEPALLEAIGRFNQIAETLEGLLLNVGHCGTSPAKVSCQNQRCQVLPSH